MSRTLSESLIVEGIKALREAAQDRDLLQSIMLDAKDQIRNLPPSHELNLQIPRDFRTNYFSEPLRKDSNEIKLPKGYYSPPTAPGKPPLRNRPAPSAPPRFKLRSNRRTNI